jgi:hypothetical protein
MLLGGTNGLTNFYKPFTQRRQWILGLYLVTLAMVVVAYVFCIVIVRSRLGRVLVAVRDKETRLYFAGYKPYAFKVFAFAIGAMLAGLGGMLYPAQVGIITPQNMNIETSIFMVILVAVGGRGKLWGAVFGAIVMSVFFSSLSSDLPKFWPFVLGAIYIFVPLVFPQGFVGMWSLMEEQISVRAGFKKVAITIGPLVFVSLFILMEGLGLTPGFLQYTIKVPMIGDPVQWKYLLLVALLTGTGCAYWAQKRNESQMRRAPGFSPQLATAIGRPSR